MISSAVENLEPFLKPGAHVLDIGESLCESPPFEFTCSCSLDFLRFLSFSGSGSGYLLSIFHKLVAPSGTGGTVLGIDHLSSLVSLGISNLSSDPTTSASLHSSAPPLSPGTISNILADGRQGAPSSYFPPEGFSAIHVGAASPVYPEALENQLKKGGRMFVPIGQDWGEQAIWQIDKLEDGQVVKKKLFGVRYIP